MIAQRGGTARRIIVTATITATKGRGGIRIQSSHLDGVLEGLEGIDPGMLETIAAETAQECTISNAIRGNVEITHALAAR